MWLFLYEIKKSYSCIIFIPLSVGEGVLAADSIIFDFGNLGGGMGTSGGLIMIQENLQTLHNLKQLINNITETQIRHGTVKITQRQNLFKETEIKIKTNDLSIDITIDNNF